MIARFRFLLDHPGYPAGTVARVTPSGIGGGLPPGVIAELQRRGIVEPIKEPKKASKPTKKRSAPRKKRKPEGS